MRVKKKLAITDIARSLNVSVTTVSFIMNGRAKEKRISEALVKKVQDYIEEVGYKPDSLARSLRTGKSKTIGVLVEDIANPFFASFARVIEDIAYKRGYHILYSSTDNDPAKTKDLLHILKERQVDGYIIVPAEGISEEINDLLKTGKPVVLFDRALENVDTDYVGIDNEKSTFEATMSLIKQRYHNIGFVTIDSNQSQMLDRKAGYLKALKEYGQDSFVKEIPFTENGEELIEQVISFLADVKLDAVLFGTNYLAVNGLRAIYRKGIPIPAALGVVAFDHHDVFELSNPSISAITQPVDEMAQTCIDILLNRLNNNTTNEKFTPQHVIMDTCLKLRQSTRN